MRIQSNRTMLLTTLFALMTMNSLFAQTKQFAASTFSHFYLVLDSIAYKNLKNDPFCRDTLFNATESKVATDQGTWSGNYLMGKKDYWEIMNPLTTPGVAVGDMGLGHMLRRPGEVYLLQKQWQGLTNDQIELHAFTRKSGADTIIVELMNYRDSMLMGGKASFFIMYYHPSILLRSGFSKEQLLTTGVDESILYSTWYADTPYHRLYDRVEKIHLQLTPHEFSRHRLALEAMGYSETGTRLFSKEIEINVELASHPASRLRKIEFSLLADAGKRTIYLSNSTRIEIAGNKGALIVE